ncbi:LysR family transcriptional regulator [Paraburkholderia sp. GAS334]|uniref:LysR family transcriptional regulator n=1 Tax=Paraburkholderia sp. GAS334 TaxID=3035131 RepID=UPI003D1BF1CD
MDLRHLRHFVAVTEEELFGRAANRFQIVQPALSTQIPSMEGDLQAERFILPVSEKDEDESTALVCGSRSLRSDPARVD